MKNNKVFRLIIDSTFELVDISTEHEQKISDVLTRKVIDYPCSKWEVSCILVPASTTKLFVEFKRYENDGKQIIESHYVTEFKIIELCQTSQSADLLLWTKQNVKKFKVKAEKLLHRFRHTWQTSDVKEE